MGHPDAQAVHHDHGYVRQSLAMVRAAFGCHQTPPYGHAYWRFLQDAATYLAHDLPRHIAYEEAHVFPLFEPRHGLELIERLHAEHCEILRLAQALLEALADLTPAAADRCWPIARHTAIALEACLTAHMDAEEALLRALHRDRCGAASGALAASPRPDGRG